MPNMGASVRSNMGTRRGGGWATMRGNDHLAKFKEKLETLLSRNIDIDWCEKPFSRTALWEAAWKNHEAVVRILAAQGANVAAADYQGRTPLHEAAFYGHTSLLEFLLDKGHPINCEDIFGQTPLFRAVEGGRHDVVKLLVERGANANMLDKDRVTAQHVAAFNGMPSLSHFLLNHGAVKNRFRLDDGIAVTAGGAGVVGSATVGAPKGPPQVALAAAAAAKRFGGGSHSGLAAAGRPLKAGATLMFGDNARSQRRLI
mmetsp:Transcript_133169/g.336353  ORF Transcript_133169/g.336353 Transcript_133169/m.336353 type:complete len:258 (-) Transcript_133169:66-839(-)